MLLASASTGPKTGTAAVEFADTVGSWKHPFGFDGAYGGDSYRVKEPRKRGIATIETVI